VLLVHLPCPSGYSAGSRAAARRSLPPTTPRARAPAAVAEYYAAGFMASAVSTAAVYPVETYKVRMQAANPFVRGGTESPLSLLRGLELGLAKECPNAAIYLGAYESLRAHALAQPALEGREAEPLVVFCVALVCGALGDAAGSWLRLPFELVGKNVQAGGGVRGQPFGEALGEALPRTDRARFVLQTWVAVLARDMPFGAFQLCFYELAQLAFAPALGADSLAAHLVEGATAGAAAAIVTTPIDCAVTRLMVRRDGAVGANGATDVWRAAIALWEEQGPAGFTRGWNARALQYAPAAMLFFAAFETFCQLLGVVH
jgi:hypothetical protein